MPSWFPRMLRYALAVALVLAGAGSTSHAAGTGVIETPDQQTTQTGVGLISGWHCTARQIQIRIDDGALQTAGSRTGRADTRAVCGRADTGYGLLFNFNLLSPGSHRLTAYADGIPFAEREFHTITFGAPWITPGTVRAPVLNFPEIGMQTTVTWNQEAQNFGADIVQLAPTIGGDYYGATTLRDCRRIYSSRPATYSVTFDGRMMGVTIVHADGETTTFSPEAAALEEDGYVHARFGGWRFAANGERLTGSKIPVFGDICPTEPVEIAAK